MTGIGASRRKGRRAAASVATALVLGSIVGASPAMAGGPVLNVFTVNETGDQSDANLADAPNACDVAVDAGEQCTLRAAIEESNATSGTDVIAFGIPGTGLHTVKPQTVLPSLSDQVRIDGYTQPGASVNTARVGEPIDAVLRIQLTGEDIDFGPGLVVGSGAAGSEVSGLVINRFPFSGIQVDATVTVRGNFIGTNAAGNRGRGNNVAVLGLGAGADVGGTLPAHRNLLSGNRINGVGSNRGMTIRGNYIGTERDGRSALPNDENGIALTSLTPSTIGGPGGEANVIAFNGGDGVMFSNPSAGTLITRNRIFSNGSLGIDLGDDGITANDPGDGDTGSNNRQNFPVLTVARTARGDTKIKGRLDSTASESFTVEFFSNRGRERQGRKFIGARPVTTDGSGEVDFTFRPNRKVPVGDFITATATASDNSTSEFSAPRRVRGP